MTYPSGQTNSGPPRRYGGGGGGGGGVPLSMEGAENWNTLWVDKTTDVYVADGSVQYPYNTITAALVAAAALLPTASNPVAIVVMPGVYDEQVTLATPYVYLFGWDRDTTIITNVASPTLDVTTQYTGVRNLTVRTTYNGAVAPFVRVRTVGAAFTNYVRFYDCLFLRAAAGNARFDIETDTRVIITRCVFRLDPFVAALRVLVMGTRTYVDVYDTVTDSGFWVNAGGGTQCYFRAFRCSLRFLYPYVGANCEVYDCDIRDDGYLPPIYIGGAVPVSLIVKGCRLGSNSGAVSTYDIFSGLAVTGAVIENNVMGLGTQPGGIDPNVSHVNPIKYVGSAGNKDFYNTTQDALTACTFDDCVVKLLKDETVGAGIVVPANRVVTIDGNGKHSLTISVVAIMFSLASNQNLTLLDLVVNGPVQANSAGSTARFRQCLITQAVVASDGTILIEDSSVVADATWIYAIWITGANATMTVKRSRLKGNGVNAAIVWNAAILNNNLKIEHSTITHGSGAANDPFSRGGAQVPNYRAHHTAFNAPPGAGWATNLIAPAQQFNTVDPNTDF